MTENMSERNIEGQGGPPTAESPQEAQRNLTEIIETATAVSMLTPAGKDAYAGLKAAGKAGWAKLHGHGAKGKDQPPPPADPPPDADPPLPADRA